MKFKRLSLQELEDLRSEFIDFLVIVGITAEEWEELLTKEPVKASDVIDQFSDVVWEGILRKAKYLHRITRDAIYAFHCEEKQIHLLRLKDIEPNADLTNEEYRANRLANPSGLKLAKKSKAYSKERELELFDLLISGAVIGDGHFYEAFDRD